MRLRAMGILFVLSGVFFVAGVLDPPILRTWGGSATDVMATASAHRAAWARRTSHCWHRRRWAVSAWPSCAPARCHGGRATFCWPRPCCSSASTSRSGGALLFPQFPAFIAIGIAMLIRRPVPTDLPLEETP